MAAKARRDGPLRFDEVVEIALYDPEVGFYSKARGASRRRDFLTSPGVGPLFGAVLARALDRWWRDLGCPDPFSVVEAGAGDGTLATSIHAAAPDCLPALRYLMVERSASLRELHERLPFESAAEMPAPGWCDAGVVLANELLDNLPFRLLERHAGEWADVIVDETLQELTSGESTLSDGVIDQVFDALEGARIPLQEQAADWLRAALQVPRRGRVVVIDYCDTTSSMAHRPWRDWVRTYRNNGPGTGPLESLGDQDITCEVAVDQLAAVRPPMSDTAQADFLRDHGLDELSEAARREWEQRAHIGDLQALRARSRASEAAALTDPAGLGAFRVLEWEVPG